MKIIISSHTDPYFNLASEEYLLDNVPGEIFMLWRNEPAVIIGRSQNAFAELNSAFIREHGIKVVRRLTGGGAVFHDLGNVNFTYIVPRGESAALDFARFTEPVIAALRKLGVPAELSGRNDIVAVLDGEMRKISGNAQCVRSASCAAGGIDRIMHHGTLLYSADMSRLVGALNVDPEKIKAKGIKSVRSRVANINEYLSDKYKGMDASDFMAFMSQEIKGDPYSFTECDITAIKTLADEKYSVWEYTYGSSRQFEAVKKKYFEFGTVEVGFNADNGVIGDVTIKGDFFGVRDTSELCSCLCGCKLDNTTLVAALSNVGEYIMGATPVEIAELFI
jgi:lipoyltransferase and lipoate-protein ligase